MILTGESMDFAIRVSPYLVFRKSPITGVRANLKAGLRRVPLWVTKERVRRSQLRPA